LSGEKSTISEGKIDHQIGICRIDYTPTPHKNQDLPLNYRYPPISAKAATMEVAGFFVPILSVLATLLKSRFFVIYFRGVTLADGMADGQWPPLQNFFFHVGAYHCSSASLCCNPTQIMLQYA